MAEQESVNRGKNACFVVQHFFPADIRVLKEAMVLRSHGYAVSVIALRDEGEKAYEFTDGISIHRVRQSKRRGSKLRYAFEYLTFFIYAFYKLNIIDMRNKVDVVHINTLPDFLVFAAVVQKIKRRRIILDMHEIMPEFFISKFGVNPRSWVVKTLLFLEKVSLRFADGAITVNDPIKRVFQKRAIPGKPVAVVMNTVDKGAVVRKPKTSHEGFNCVYHGTLTDIYGLDTAIVGFAKACRQAQGLRFNIYGSGHMLQDLQKLVNDLGVQGNVYFHGRLRHESMMEALSSMDLGILALRKDIFLNLSFSNKLAEYVYLEIPVVSSDLDATRFYFNEDQLLFFEAGNTDSLAEKILSAYRNPRAMKIMAQKAIQQYANYDWEIMAQRYFKIVNTSPIPADVVGKAQRISAF